MRTTTIPKVDLYIPRPTATRRPRRSCTWTVTFSEAVTGVDCERLPTVVHGPTGASINPSVSGSGTTYTVTVNNWLRFPAHLGLNLVDDDTIIDTDLNKLAGTGANSGDFNGDQYTITKDESADG